MSSPDCCRRVTWARWRLLLEALATLLCWRLALAVLPFRYLVERLRLRPTEATGAESDACAESAVGVGWAVRALACRAPWLATCLTQALAAMVMLRRRGIPATLHLGVSTSAGGLAAHAWLCCGQLILTGEGGRDRFRTIASYTWSPADPGRA